MPVQDRPSDGVDVTVARGRIDIDGVGIAYQRFVGSPVAAPQDTPGAVNASAPTVVMLHEGLGSITQWRDLPEVLARRCRLDVIAYDRGGYGRSDPFPATYGDGFMTREAIEMLPAVLDGLGVARPILVGHSDGASIALIAVGMGAVSPLGVATIAPHTFIEDICVDGIRSISTQSERVICGLARHHDNPRLAFERWRDVWLTDEFRDWDITALLGDIKCPLLVLQGDGDQYGTNAQVTTIVEMAPDATGHVLANCGHVAHRDQPAQIADYLADFVSACAAVDTATSASSAMMSGASSGPK
ncbi:alpha/beta fold hydrolase [Candidatus Poriferisodalis sp.]|uniref:alpha/beta fold hydrolase n=1 Tax=Candidatus Poriferisodalis sp. TaxID=3101277 RepID=UPI003D0D4EA2